MIIRPFAGWDFPEAERAQALKADAASASALARTSLG
jgi:hypothetical protein